MRFLHTSDWHLGKNLCGASLLDDQAHALEQVLLAIRDTRPGALVIAGDIYDRSVPPKEAVRLLDGFLTQVVRDSGVPVLIIAGNHDSPERLGFGSDFLKDQQLHVHGFWSMESEPLVLENAAFHLIPYADPAMVRYLLADESLRTHQEALEAQLVRTRLRQPNGLRSVVVAHAFVTGGHASESELSLSVGGTGEVDGRLFEAFDYTALGHLHRPQDVGGKSHIHYAGSLLKYSASEAEHVKAMTLVELPERGPASTEPLPFSPRRDVRRLRGHFQELLEEEDTGCREDYLFVELLDSGPVLDAMARLRQRYPNLLGVRNAEDDAFGDISSLNVDHRSLDPETLFERFFLETTGSGLSEEERAIYREVLNQATVDAGRFE
jgi:exonuclease SbcD